MQLNLEIKKIAGKPAKQPSAHSFGQDGGTIGRSPENDWVLHDPTRFTSKIHAKISFSEAQFRLTDTSTNGSFHNSPDTRIAHNQSVMLSSGDRIFIGGLEILATVVETSASPADPEPPPPPSPPIDSETPPPLAKLVEPASPTEIPAKVEAKDPPAVNPIAAPRDAMPPLADKKRAAARDAASGSAGPQNQFFEMPKAASEDLIPEGWDDLLEGLGTGSFAAPVAKRQPSRANKPAHVGQPAQKIKPASAPQSVQRPATPARHVSGAPAATDASMGRQLLEAMGVAMPISTTMRDDELVQLVGQAFQLITEGLMQVLQSRAEIKDSFRIGQTRIGPIENNPLKFSPDSQVAIKRMFVGQDDGFLGPVAAFGGALDDIKAHQVAVLAGMKSTMESLLAKFSPQRLEAKLKKLAPKSANMPVVGKAKLWDLFVDQFDETLHAVQDDLDRLFATEFARAYEKKSSELAMQRKKQKTELKS